VAVDRKAVRIMKETKESVLKKKSMMHSKTRKQK